MKYKVKIIAKYRGANNVEYSIPAEEAHKAYYLFLTPSVRTIFSTGLAIKGEDVERIDPDYVGTMGWNPTHVLTEDDHNELDSLGVKRKLKSIMEKAQAVARLENPPLNMSLPEAVKLLPESPVVKDIRALVEKFSIK